MSLVTQKAQGADAQLISITTYILIATWVVSIADAYRVGKLLSTK